MLLRPTLLFLLLLAFGFSTKGQTPSFWLTDPKSGILFEKQQVRNTTIGEPTEKISLYTDSLYQSMDGFGFTLSQGSASHLLSMSDLARLSILQELFGFCHLLYQISLCFHRKSMFHFHQNIHLLFVLF